MAAPKIDSYHFGLIVIDGQNHRRDVIILPERVISGWWRERGHLLQPGDLKDVLAAHPNTLVVGQGAYSRMSIAAETRAALQSARIQLIEQPSVQAVETYNRLREESLVAAAIHLTC